MMNENNLRLEKLFKKTTSVINFLSELEGETFLIQSFRSISENLYRNKDIRSLEEAFKEILSSVEALNTEEKGKLHQLLINEFDYDLENDPTFINTMSSIFNRKGISSEEEFRVVHEFLNNVEEGDKYYDKREELGYFILQYLNENNKN